MINNNNIEIRKAIKEAIYKMDNKVFINICAYNLSTIDWRNLIEFFNHTYKINFKEYITYKTTNFIEYDKLLDFWNNKTDNGYMASFKLNNISINCYFNSMKNLELDIFYNEILKNNNLELILNFISTISTIINKPVYIEEENYNIENKLVEFYKDKILLIGNNK
jgi:hypothetical protein